MILDVISLSLAIHLLCRNFPLRREFPWHSHRGVRYPEEDADSSRFAIHIYMHLSIFQRRCQPAVTIGTRAASPVRGGITAIVQIFQTSNGVCELFCLYQND